MKQEIKESSQNQAATAGQNAQDEPAAESRSAKPADAAPETPAGGGSAPSPCSECDPFGLGCNPEDMENPDFIHGTICSVASESDLQGVLGLLRQTLESNQAPIRLHLSVYQVRNII